MTVTPLELLHPDGPGRTVVVIGSRVPPALAPNTTAAEGEADVVVAAPGLGEADAAWLASLRRTVDAGLRDDGLVYAAGDARTRRAIAKELRGAGFRTELTITHRPAHAAPKLLVPLSRRSFDFVARETVPTSRWRSRTLRAVAPGAHLLAPVVGGAGAVLRRPGGRPLLAWLGRADAEPVLLLATERTEFAVLLLVGRDGRLAEVVKAAAGDSAQHVIAETLAIDELGAAAVAAGADVPAPTLLSLTGATVSRRPPATGVRAEIILRRDPHAARHVFAPVAAWLDRWNAAAGLDRSAEPFKAAVASIEELRAELHDADAYARRLGRLTEPPTLQRVAVHADLTAANVYVDGSEISVTDWEDARSDGLPLSDLVYWAVDVAAACDGYADRAEAFRRTFYEDGPYAHAVRGALDASAATRGIDGDTRRLLFHATWLQHAVNEHRARVRRRPFLDIVRLLERGEDPL